MTSNVIRVLEGDILLSRCQTLVNTVNTVGVMGKGIALEFRRRYPEMFEDYERRCRRKQVRLGVPYVYVGYGPDRLIVNFPTKEHWRSSSRFSDIVDGMQYLIRHSSKWGVTSIACPPLGCGNGGLEWRRVGPFLYQSLRLLNVPVELYAPRGTPAGELTLEFLLQSEKGAGVASSYSAGLRPALLALADIVWRIERAPYHWPVGHKAFQKIAYFAQAAGIRTDVAFERGAYGPFGEGLKRITSVLVNNGLIAEQHRGEMIEVTTTGDFGVARKEFVGDLAEYELAIRRVTELALRLPPNELEIGAAAHWVATKHRGATELDVLNAVVQWKARRFPDLAIEDVALTIRVLKELGLMPASTSVDLPVPDALDDYVA